MTNLPAIPVPWPAHPWHLPTVEDGEPSVPIDLVYEDSDLLGRWASRTTEDSDPVEPE